MKAVINFFLKEYNPADNLQYSRAENLFGLSVLLLVLHIIMGVVSMPLLQNNPPIFFTYLNIASSLIFTGILFFLFTGRYNLAIWLFVGSFLYLAIHQSVNNYIYHNELHQSRLTNTVIISVMYLIATGLTAPKRYFHVIVAGIAVFITLFDFFLIRTYNPKTIVFTEVLIAIMLYAAATFMSFRFLSISSRLLKANERLKLLNKLKRSQKQLLLKEAELQQQNEEIASQNEELRSTNEEVRAINEELEETNADVRRINEELRRTDNHLHLALENSGVAVWDIDIETGESRHSVTWNKFFGYAESEASGNIYKLNDRIHPSDRRLNQLRFLELLKGRKSKFESEYRLRTKSGNYLWVLAKGKITQRDENGKATHLTGTTQIIQRRKIAEINLFKAKEKAEEADHLKSVFLANMSHEVRTPLNAILGFISLLNYPVSEEKRKEYVRVIRNNSEALLNIIDDIVTISKIEAGHFTIHYDKIRLSVFLRQLEGYALTLQKQMKKEHLNISLFTAPEISDLVLEAPENRLLQILKNLVNNALKFTEKGEVQIGCRLVEKTQVQFSVKDTGIGISSKNQAIIFKRFRQVDEGFKRRYGGTGLGLTIAKQLIEMLGGEIWVESVENEGSTFFFFIPLKAEA